MAAAPVPVLDFSTLPTRHPIRINGTTYELRDPIEVSVEDNIYLAANMPRLGELMLAFATPGRVGAGDEAEATQIARRICRMAIDGLPPPILQAMSLMQMAAVCNSFLQLPPLPVARLEAMLKAIRHLHSTGEKSSAPSTATTQAARPSRGSVKRRSTRSART